MGYSSYRYMRRDFEKSVEVDLVVLSRFPEAAERDQESRGIRNSSPGLGVGYGTAWLGVLRRFSHQGLDYMVPESLLVLNFMTDGAIGPKDKGFHPFFLDVHFQSLLWDMSAVKDVNRKGLSIKRITPPIDLSSKKTFFCRNV